MIKKILKNILIATLIFLPTLALATSIETLPATHISYENAKLWGSVHDYFSAPNLNLRFYYSTNAGSSCKNMPNHAEVSGQAISSGYFNATLSNLTSGTTYYFCALAWYQNDPIIYGQVLSFKTLGVAPSQGGTSGSGSAGTGSLSCAEVPPGTLDDCIKTGTATGVTDIEATLSGRAEGVTGTVFGYFRYSTAAVPPIFCNEIYGSNMRSATAQLPNASGQIQNGSFSAKVTNLEKNTTYYYCAVGSNKALNSEGSLNSLNSTTIRYGAVKSFHTLPCQTCEQTTIKTTQASVLSSSSATLRGQFGSTKAVTTYFEYKNSELPGDWIKTGEIFHSANSYGGMNELVKGLKTNTEYIFRAVGKTSDPTETFYGQTLHFRTRTADGFGDGEGWIYQGDNPWEQYNPNNPYNPYDPYDPNNGNNPYDPYNPYGPANPTQTCGQASGPDAPITNCDNNNGGNNGGYGGGYSGGGYGGYTPIDYTGIGNGIGSGNGDFDGDGIINSTDIDIDGDGANNIGDNDTDGDGIGNAFDTDDDNDGIFDSSDQTPLGNGSNFNDLDGDGLSNSVDTDDDGDGIPDISDSTPFGTGSNPNDLDGDGINNSIDTDIDGDGIPNNTDPDDDNDGLPDNLDNSASGNDLGGGNGNNNGGNQNQGNILGIGDETTPPQDAIVRYHEGVETVFIRQIMRNTTLAKKYGYQDGEDLQKFSWYLAHFLAKSYGYVAKNKKEIRVRYADVAAYELREVGNTTTVYESYDNAGNGKFKITGIRKLNSLFKMIFKYEYYFLKRK